MCYIYVYDLETSGHSIYDLAITSDLDPPPSAMKYDDLVEYLGEFGPYQRKIYCLACLPVVAASVQTLITVFILAQPDHRSVDRS